jgi:ribosome-binding protein aMBF1 (putative translation factor)
MKLLHDVWAQDVQEDQTSDDLNKLPGAVQNTGRPDLVAKAATGCGMVGRNVRRLRTAAGLSQAELAERMGVDRAYVSGLELGQRNPTIVTLWHITRALGVKAPGVG